METIVIAVDSSELRRGGKDGVKSLEIFFTIRQKSLDELKLTRFDIFNR